MPLTPSISVSQNNGTPSQFSVQDTSTGSDPGLTERRVYLYNSANNTVVPSGTLTNYIVWPIADSSITIDVLSRDMAFMIVVNWMTGSTVTYTYTNYYQFPANTKVFLYNLSVTQQLSNPNIIKDTQYLFNKLQLYTYVKDADNAVALGPDISKAQLAFDLAYEMMSNSNLYF